MLGDDIGAGPALPRMAFWQEPAWAADEAAALQLPGQSPGSRWMRRNPGYYPYLPGEHDEWIPATDPTIGSPDPSLAVPTPSGRYMRPSPSDAAPAAAAMAEAPFRPAPERSEPDGTGRDVTQADATALPDGYHLAQSTGNARRPFALIGPTGRDLTPPQWMRWQNWNSGTDMLRQIDPKNPLLQNLYGPNWVPDSERDIAPLYREIGRIRAEQALADLERHHPLPNQYGTLFRDNGISDAFRENTTNYLWRNDHRGRGGLHPFWNRDWGKFFSEYPLEGQGPVLENLREMLEKYDQWYGW